MDAPVNGPQPTRARRGAGWVTIALASLSMLVALMGLAESSDATFGVALLVFACWLGIMARIAQAGDHHFED